ncbi:MAG: hypothetical protein L6Q35_06155 [Phycisphaerales bacterium]|nr:hypothetical protein [Phycisphaerales bacterium]
MSINSVAVSAVGVMVAVVVGAARADGPVYPPTPVASDWCAMGTDCSLIGAGDLDGDGFAELLTINGNRDLCSAVNVQGWKSGGWIAVRGEMPADATGFVVAEIDAAAKGPEVVVVSPGCALLVSRYDQDKYQDAKRLDASPGTTFVGAAVREGAIVITDSAGKYWRVEGGELRAVEALGAESAETSLQISPPPYEPAAKLLTMCSGDFTGDGKPDRAGLFDATIPHPHRVVRVVMAPDDRGPAERLDRDFDGLTDAEETAIGSNPLDRDTDMDGLLDGWEVKGLPRGIALGDRIRLFDPSDPKAHGTLSPLRQDVICVLSYFEGVDPKQMEAELPRVEALYRDLSNKNPDGSTGLWVHFRVEKTFVSKADQAMPWWDVGNKYFAANERGFLHWLQITPWGGGQSGQTADMGGAGNNWAVIAHEFGHQLSLSHEGDSAAPWCPLYTSLMSYAFSYGFDGDGNRIHFSKGQFRQTELDERKLDEKLNYPYDQVKYLANWPYRFTLKDTGNSQRDVRRSARPGGRQLRRIDQRGDPQQPRAVGIGAGAGVRRRRVLPRRGRPDAGSPVDQVVPGLGYVVGQESHHELGDGARAGDRRRQGPRPCVPPPPVRVARDEIRRGHGRSSRESARVASHGTVGVPRGRPRPAGVAPRRGHAGVPLADVHRRRCQQARRERRAPAGSSFAGRAGARRRSGGRAADHRHVDEQLARRAVLHARHPRGGAG